MNRLREDAYLRITYADETPYGSGLSGLFDALLQRSCAALEKVVAVKGLAGLEAEAEIWMPKVMAPKALGSFYERPDTLREACVHPPAEQVVPVALDVAVPGTTAARLPVLPDLAAWLGAWQRDATRPRCPQAAALWDRLDAMGAFEPSLPPAQPLRDGVTFIGHATVAVQRAGVQVLFDPFLLRPAADDPAHARPHTPCDLRPDAVFITHSHPDHYDLSTLLRFDHDTTIVVPEVERESLLSTDMAYRLRELGFTDVRSLRWHDGLDVGPIRVTALPFYGEQPTDGEMLHPEARNAGNTYVAEVAGTRIGLIADAGTDAAGRTTEMAAAARDALGPIDVLFGGYRAWHVQPIRYLFSSVARYLLFVPPQARTRWQKIMNDADDLVDTAEAWGARQVVPYANGGTPWFARIGLGPREDGSDDPRVDPPASAVEQAFERREGIAANLLPMAAGDDLGVA